MKYNLNFLIKKINLFEKLSTSSLYKMNEKIIFKKAIHPNLYLTGQMDDSFFENVIYHFDVRGSEKITMAVWRHATSYLDLNNEELKAKEKLIRNQYNNFILNKIISYVRSINPNIDTDSLKETFYNTENTERPPFFFVLHDAIHEILIPGSTRKFQISEEEMQKRDTFSPQHWREEDTPAILTNRDGTAGIFVFIQNELLSAAEKIFPNPSSQLATIYSNVGQNEYNGMELEEIFNYVKNTIRDKSKDFPQINQKIIYEMLLLINKAILEVGLNKKISIFNLTAGNRDFLTKISEITNKYLAPSKGTYNNIITDDQAKQIRLYHTAIRKIIKESDAFLDKLLEDHKESIKNSADEYKKNISMQQ